MNNYRIQLKLDIDLLTGTPCYESYDSMKPYIQSEHVVPESYRKWLHGFACDGIFNMLLMTEGCIATIAEAYENYPSYDEMTEFDNWSEDDHEEFREALGWFAKDGIYLFAVVS
jgi:hypothetical protein